MNAVSYCDKIIRYSFYTLFLLVPLIFFGNTSELFEFNKMWLAFGLTIIIGAAWISKMIIERKFILKRTPLDIFLLLFLISQIISTIFSFDSHVSFWGYYTRFNGGLLSTISYIFLYYALVSNLQVKHIARILFVSLISGLITALWGFPSHFGYDPTCLMFRGSLDTNCWTEAFKPTVRVFSTLGQPAWFAAYLDVLLPLSMIYTLVKLNSPKDKIKMLIYFAVTLLFYISLIFANTRAGTAAFFVSDIILWIILFFKKIYTPKKLLKYFLVFHFAFAVCSFFFGAPLANLDKFTFPALQKKLVVHAQEPTPIQTKIKKYGITDSGTIRLFVWQGAIDAWKAYPIFGTGVETFAFAYYRFRPPGHNTTSEWDYLYNKAHNEYLNYLTTTGIVGLGTYLTIIIVFLFLILKYIFSYQYLHNQQKGISPDLIKVNNQRLLLSAALLAGYISILITNFFGFSVVIINLYFFLIPAFFFIITSPADSTDKKTHPSINLFQWTLIIITAGSAVFMSYKLYIYWYADTAYALGNNLDKVSSFQQAYPYLENAVNLVPNEPVYKDELAVNLATLAQAFYLQNDATTGAQLAQKAVYLDNQVIDNHPNNILFWKNRLRILYSLGTSDKENETKYLQEALRVLIKARELAPTDPKITYNLGVLLGQIGNTQESVLGTKNYKNSGQTILPEQTNNLQEGIKMLEKTIELKPDYKDAYYALGLFYHQLAIGETSAAASPSANVIVKYPQMQQKAIDTYQFILDNFSADDSQAINSLKTWKEKK